MSFAGIAKELLKYVVLRCSETARRHHHRAFDNSARHYLESYILPVVAASARGRVLFVGCRSYTFHYRRYFLHNNIDYWTSDIDPAARIWGERRKHLVCDVRVLHRHVPARSFDLVMLNGVFGYGIDDIHSMNQSIGSIYRVLKPGGHLLIGWNKDRVTDPQMLPDINDHFDRRIFFGLPTRKTFEDHSHVYDLFRAHLDPL